ncbi:nidogen-1-like isoform X2 [Octopus bimaculoides]|uniref:nidogen-1-like isoform X2 n=1 Tax=Octopus bimaculoides TaxID=37653 RepID=UPI0022E11786|nr:nidogen-1-like isoform X2 [Octopus bimaculoides]
MMNRNYWRTIVIRNFILIQFITIYIFNCVRTNDALPESSFFDFGTNDQMLSNTDDISSNEIHLRLPIAFYDKKYNSIFVNNNGHLTFETELPNYQSMLIIPTGFKMIAPFLADVDTSRTGRVYYRETQNRDLIFKIQSLIARHFPSVRFRARSLFIATWHEVGYFSQKYDKTNTFQVVIASSGDDSFVLFNYDDKIEWIKGEGKGPHPDPPVQMGFDSGADHYQRLPYSGSDEAAYVANYSNIGVKGQYLYHISDKYGKQIRGPPEKEEIDGSGSDNFDEDLGPAFCKSDHNCHHTAKCIDYATGYCCQCSSVAYGNGVNCLKKETPQQLNGRITLTLNKTRTFNLNRHSYIITTSGRAYTVVSSIAEETGLSVILLDGINSFLGFLFGTTESEISKNGYMITGGDLNHTVKVTFETGEEIYIQERFFSQDTDLHMRAETNITGTLPWIRTGGRIIIDMYNEDFVHTEPGVLRSRTTRVYWIDGVGKKYTWDQKVEFTECMHDPSINTPQTFRHTIKKIYYGYKQDKQTISFIAASGVRTIKDSGNCEDVTCGDHSYCVVSGDNYSCPCNQGYEMENYKCADVDECPKEVCGENEQCFNTPGSYVCRCTTGYESEGGKCKRRDCPEPCHPQAQCVYNYNTRSPKCECSAGYRGDGHYCELIVYSCNEVNNCGRNAACVYSPEEGRYKCECESGFSGDGMMCSTTELEENCENCDEHAHCFFDTERLFHHCRCNAGFTGDGRTCTYIDTCRQCSPYADCVFEQTLQQHVCRCKPRYEGNGQQCSPRRCPRCGQNARCQYDPERNSHRCVCEPGYTGDGRYCQPSTSCHVVNNCDRNADCVPDRRQQGHYICQCKAGYKGNGLKCVEREISCNLQNHCHEHAVCVYHDLVRHYQCICKSGYEGDGINCRRKSHETDCAIDRSLCHAYAECQAIRERNVCVCRPGFRGDGIHCSTISESQNYLVFIRGKSILKMPYSHSRDRGKRISSIPDQTPIALAYDCVEKQIYYSDIESYTIRKMDTTGNYSGIVVENVKSEGIAIDWISRNMYWTDSRKKSVEVTKLDGTHRKTLFNTKISNPRGIVVDPIRGILYWVDWMHDNPRIEKANMDGSDRQLFVHDDLKLPNAITLDLLTNQLCWGDKALSKIECVHFNGVGRRVLYKVQGHEFGIFDMVFSDNNIYWTDWTKSTISNIKWNANKPSEPLSPPTGGHGKMYGITTITDTCPRNTNACAHDNGGCRFLCLPTFGSGRTCMCPDDVDNNDCSSGALLQM